MKQIVIAGKREDDVTQQMLNAVASRFIPNKILLLVDGSKEQGELFGANSFLKSLVMIDGKPTVYVCEDFVCQLPTTNVDVLVEQLE